MTGSRIVGLAVVGAALALGTALVGFLWLNQTPDLHPEAFGEHAELTAGESGAATIFTPIGRGTAPECRVTTQDGREVRLGEPQRYQQSSGMESSYGFTTSAGTTYAVSCGTPGQAGRFAVAEVSRFPETVFLVTGALGLVTIAGSGVLAWRHRRTDASRPARAGAG